MEEEAVKQLFLGGYFVCPVTLDMKPGYNCGIVIQNFEAMKMNSKLKGSVQRCETW